MSAASLIEIVKGAPLIKRWLDDITNKLGRVLSSEKTKSFQF